MEHSGERLINDRVQLHLGLRATNTMTPGEYHFDHLLIIDGDVVPFNIKNDNVTFNVRAEVIELGINGSIDASNQV